MSIKIENLSVQTSPDVNLGYTVYDDGTQTSRLQLKKLIDTTLTNPIVNGKLTTSKIVSAIVNNNNSILLEPFENDNSSLSLSVDTSTSVKQTSFDLVSLGINVLNSYFYDEVGTTSNNITLGSRGNGVTTNIKGDTIKLQLPNNKEIKFNSTGIYLTGATSVMIPRNTTKFETGEKLSPIPIFVSNDTTPSLTFLPETPIEGQIYLLVHKIGESETLSINVYVNTKNGIPEYLELTRNIPVSIIYLNGQYWEI